MPTQSHAVAKQSIKQNAAKDPLGAVRGPAAAASSLEWGAAVLPGYAQETWPTNQRSPLGDPRLPLVQRQAQVARYAKTGGNQSVQELLVRRKDGQADAQSTPASDKAPGTSSEDGVENGTAARTIDSTPGTESTQAATTAQNSDPNAQAVQADSSSTQPAPNRATTAEATGEIAQAAVSTSAEAAVPAAASTSPEPVGAAKSTPTASALVGPASGAQPATTGTPVTGGAGAKEEKAPASPAEDPGFQAVAGQIKGVAARERAHAPAGAKAAEAQAAAESPAAEIASQAATNQVGEMAGAPTPGFDAAAFKRKLFDRIAAVAPKTAKEADEFKASNKLNSVKGALGDDVTQQREAAQAPLTEATEASPDTSAVEPKSVTPLPPSQQEPAPTLDTAGNAAPKPKSAAEIETPLLTAGQPVEQQMAAAGVTDEQLAQANEPAFSAALTAKWSAAAHSRTAPSEVRAAERGELNQAQADATAQAAGQLDAIHGDRAAALGQVQEQQGAAKRQDESQRAEIAAHIEEIYGRTKNDVEQILGALDVRVSEMFDAGAGAAKERFENYVKTKVDEYKEKRYSGVGALLAVTDFLKLTSLPPEVDAIYQAGRDQFLSEMSVVIDDVTQLIGGELNRAKATVAAGRQEIQQYVASLPGALRQVGQEASGEIAGRFDELEQSVDAKQTALIDTLANKYQEHLQAVDTSIQAKMDANKSLWDAAGDLLGSVFQTIEQLKGMLAGVLARAGAVVDQIIMDPIRFLGNLVSGVKQGLQNFVGNITTHLQGGLVQWLTGTIAAAGITLPETWDLQGIFQLVMQLLGLGFETLIGKLSQLFGIDIMSIIDPIKQLVAIYRGEGLAGLAKAGLANVIGEERMQALLQVWDMVQALIGGNWDKLWGLMMDQLTGLKEMVFGKIESFIAEDVIKAGITWIIGLLNPASAFIKACKAIYDMVMFFVERGAQITSLVNAVIDSVASIAGGNLGAAASAVENALATGLPVAIGFLGSMLGLGNVSEKVQEIVQSARALVDKGINAILNSRPVQMVVGFIKKAVEKAKSLAKVGVKKGKGALGTGRSSGAPNVGGVGDIVSFQGGGESHRMWIREKGTSTTVMVASVEESVGQKLARWKSQAHTLGKKQGEAEALIAKALRELDITEKAVYEAALVKQQAEDQAKASPSASAQGGQVATPAHGAAEEYSKKDKEVVEDEKTLSQLLAPLFDLFGEKRPLDPITQAAVDHAVKHITGLTLKQAEVLFEEAFSRKSSVVFGGSRVRGDFTEKSDVDIGFGGLSKRQATRVLKGFEKAGVEEREGKQTLVGLEPEQKIKIVPGVETEHINKIESPQEFFMRSGTRAPTDPKGGTYQPSGFIAYEPTGEIIWTTASGENKVVK